MTQNKRFGPRLKSRSFFWQRGKRSDSGTVPGASAAMTATMIERIWIWIHATFPERQIYIRSDGRVQFFTFGPSLQATLAGLVLIFLGWVAFATVNVIFKDRIITAKDHRFQEMQAAYETRLADLQITYDELNGALVGAEDRFKTAADDLQVKQNTIAGFLNRKAQVEASIAPSRDPLAMQMRSTSASGFTGHDDGPASDSLGVAAPARLPGTFAPDSDNDSALSVMPGPASPQPRIAKPEHAGLLDGTWTKLRKLATALFTPRAKNPDALSAVYAKHPGLRALAAQTARVTAMGHAEGPLMGKTRDILSNDMLALRDIVRRTGINPDQFQRKIANDEGVGGPEIPLDRVQVNGIQDSSFNASYLHASAILSQLSDLSFEMRHIPLALPVAGTNFERTSGFGARVDPFTRRYAFHSGIDFAGPWGAQVRATAPGTVVFVGNKGGYGNMVEIDHGLGIRTRYGHLSAMTVRNGAKVEKGATIGRVGSTGRSTGPHVHYEIWYDDALQNPGKFIEAVRRPL